VGSGIPKSATVIPTVSTGTFVSPFWSSVVAVVDVVVVAAPRLRLLRLLRLLGLSR
jgi:hypothetical protein